MSVKYPFTETELEQGILKLKCASSSLYSSYITDRQAAKDSEWRLAKIAKMQSVLFPLERYNYTYYAEDSINCLTIDEVGFLLQRANQLSNECGCANYVRPVTLPDPHI